MKSTFEPKVSSIQHGKHNEVIVRSIYARKMQKQLRKNFTAYDSGLVVNPSHPYLSASPDGKVFDLSSTSPFGLLEIKCPYTWRNNSVEEACQDPNFPCAMMEFPIKKIISRGIMYRYKDSLLRSRSGRSHVTLPVPTWLLQTDIHSFLGVLRFCLLGPMSLSFSCHCIRCTNHRREHSQENESDTLIGLCPRKECMSV